MQITRHSYHQIKYFFESLIWLKWMHCENAIDVLYCMNVCWLCENFSLTIFYFTKICFELHCFIPSKIFAIVIRLFYLLIKLGIYQEDLILIYEMVIILHNYDACNGPITLRQQQRIIIDIDCQYTYPNW